MNWPLPSDFHEAIQTPALAFADPDLKAGQPVTTPSGQLLPRSGNFADVYQVRGADGRDWGVKCFTRPVPGLAERYAAVAKALAAADLPFGVAFDFLAEGIRVGGVWRPAVKMAWVEGLLLNQLVRENVGKPAVLRTLLVIWSKLCRVLRKTGLGHADLQHGNVILVPGQKAGTFDVRLIDYDGMFVPALAGKPAPEAGHPNYQHPARAAGGVFTPDVDRFPHLVVATALSGLAECGPALWDLYDTGDNLLFTEADFRTPAESKLLRTLWDSGHPTVRAFAGRLALACTRPLPQTPWLDQFFWAGQLLPLEEPALAAKAVGAAAPAPAPVVYDLADDPFDLSDIPDSFADQAGLATVGPPTKTVAGPKPPAAPESAATPKPAPKSGATPKPQPRPTPAAEEPAGRNRVPVALLAGLGAVLVLGAGVAGYLALKKPKPTETAEEPAPAVQPQVPVAVEPGGPAPVEPKPVVENKGGTAGPVVKKDDPPPPPAKQEVVRQRAAAKADPALGPALVRFTDDGRTVVVAGTRTGAVATFDAATGAAGPGFDGHRAARAVVAVGPLPGGKVWSVGAGDQTAKTWDAAAGQAGEPLVLPDLPPAPAPLRDAAVSPDGRVVVHALRSLYRTDRFVPARVAVAAAGTAKPVVEFDWVSGSVLFTPDSARLLAVDGYGRGRWFRLPGGEPDGEWQYADFKGGAARVEALAVSRDGGLVLCYGPSPGGRFGHMLLDGRTGRLTRQLGGEREYAARVGALSADGRQAALARVGAGGAAELVVLAADTGEVIGRVPVTAAGADAVAVALAPDGRTAAAYATDGTLALVDVPASPAPAAKAASVGLEPAWTAPFAAVAVNQLMVEPVSQTVALGTSDGRVPELFDLATGRPRPRFNGVAAGYGGVYPVDGGRVATGTRAATRIDLWDPRTGNQTDRFTIPGTLLTIPPAAEPVNRFARPTPDGRYAVVGLTPAAFTPGGPAPSLPLHVVELATGRPVVSTTWAGGSVHVTANSGRVLVAGERGHFQWYRLPGGQVAGGFAIPTPANAPRLYAGPEAGLREYPPLPAPPTNQTTYTPHLTGMSADGQVLGFNGVVAGGRGPGPFLLGWIGNEIRRFDPATYYYASFVSVSADGLLAAVMLAPANGTTGIEVVEVRTGRPVARVRFPQGQFVPLFTLTPDGRALLVAQPGAGARLHRYNLGPAVPAAGFAAAGPASRAVPAGDLAAVEQYLRLVFVDDDARKTPAGAKALALTLLDAADATADDPAARFVLFRLAVDAAGDSGDPALVGTAVDRFARHYDVNAGEVRLAALKKVIAAGPTAAVLRSIFDDAIAGCDAALVKDDLDAADGFVELARAAVKKGLATALLAEVQPRADQLARARKALEPFEPAVKALAANPDDPAANAAVGRYHCLRRGDWARGLPLLAKGNNPKLKAAADADLDAGRGGAFNRLHGPAMEAWDAYAKNPNTPTDDVWAAGWRARYWAIRVSLNGGGDRDRAADVVQFNFGGAAHRPGLVADYYSARPGFMNPIIYTLKVVSPAVGFPAKEFPAGAGTETRIAVKWGGSFAPLRGGLYRLAVDAGADKAIVTVKGTRVIELKAGVGSREALVTLADGLTPVTAEFDWTAGGKAAAPSLTLKWGPVGVGPQPISGEDLCHDARGEPKGFGQ